MLMNTGEYLETIEHIKAEIRAAQYKATVSVNREMILLYHSIGEVINLTRFGETATIHWGYPKAHSKMRAVKFRTTNLNIDFNQFQDRLTDRQGRGLLKLRCLMSGNDRLCEYSQRWNNVTQ